MSLKLKKTQNILSCFFLIASRFLCGDVTHCSDDKDNNRFKPSKTLPLDGHKSTNPNPLKAEPFGIPAVEVDKVSGLDAAGAGEPAAGGAAQRAALHRHVQTLGVVHRLHHGAARPGRTRMGVVGAVGRPAGRARTAGRGERREPRVGRHEDTC